MLFETILNYIKLGIECIGVLVILLGALRSVYQIFIFITQSKLSYNYIRLQFGEALSLGLEFIVGADIIGSLVHPNYYGLGIIIILVIIRSILSYFLSLELESLKHS